MDTCFHRSFQNGNLMVSENIQIFKSAFDLPQKVILYAINLKDFSRAIHLSTTRLINFFKIYFFSLFIVSIRDIHCEVTKLFACNFPYRGNASHLQLFFFYSLTRQKSFCLKVYACIFNILFPMKFF